MHIRVASPPLRYPCFMGINIPTHDELIANKLDLEQLARFIGMKFSSFADFAYTYYRAGNSCKFLIDKLFGAHVDKSRR